MESNDSIQGQSNGIWTTKVAAPISGWAKRDRPCDACRRRKSRCIIPQDTELCVLCQSRGEECTFVETPQRRKRKRPESPPGEASKARSPGLEREKANPKPPPIDDYASLPGPSLLKQTLGLQNRQHGQYLGQTTEYDPRLVNLSPFKGKDEHAIGTLRRVSPQTHFIMRSESQVQIDDELENLDLVESIVTPHGRTLVDLYFRIIHPSFPIMHKKVFLEKYDRSETSYREFTPPILAAVYILALNWWSYSPELVNLPKPDVRKLERLVPKFMSDVLNRPKLSTVQAGLLLLQCPDGDSWALTGQLVAAAQNLGLHLDCSDWKIPEWERGLRKRLAWALFMQDKWGALVHGRPPFIHADDWAVKPVEARDFPETAEDDDEEEGSSGIEDGRLIFINMILLTEILAELLETFFTLRATSDIELRGENGLRFTLERAKPIQLKLKEWYSMLPPRMAVEHVAVRKLSSTGSLHLAYFATEVTLHRAIVRFDHSSADEKIRSITRSAARMRFTSAVDLVDRLESAHLQSFWYFASKVNLAIIATFGSLLWATSSSPEEAEFYRSRLAEYRWTLRVSSKAAEFMSFTVGMLDASPIFFKARAPKTSPTKLKVPEAGSNPETKMENDDSVAAGINSEVSPSAGTESLSYEGELSAMSDTGLSWTSLPAGVNPDQGDVQNWSLDQLCNFSYMPMVEDVLGARSIVQEYDETDNDFGGF